MPLQFVKLVYDPGRGWLQAWSPGVVSIHQSRCAFRGYRSRWQIEIFFKCIKQVLDVHGLRCQCSQAAQALIAAFLVAWLLIEDQVDLLRRQITDAEPLEMPVSSWQLDRWACSGLRKVVEGWWSPQRVLALAPELRPLFQDHRQRRLQEHERRGSLSRHPASSLRFRFFLRLFKCLT